MPCSTRTATSGRVSSARYWRIRSLSRLWRELWELVQQCSEEISTTLMSLADGADLLFTGLAYEQPAANVAEYLRNSVRHAALRPGAGQRPAPAVPAGAVGPLRNDGVRLAGLARGRRRFEDAQRRELGLPKATGPVPRRMAERGSLEIQAYDEVCFPGLAAEWAKFDGRRPFVGALTMELPTDADEEVASWIAAGTPPIFFGFGSMLVESPGRNACHDRRGVLAVR